MNRGRGRHGISYLPLFLLLAACQGKRSAKPAPPPPLPLPLPRLEVKWDPGKGKGAVLSRMKNGDVLRTCFQCGYPAYTGALVIGSYSGSGMGLYPKTPIRGFKAINVFCAQDESIRDQPSGEEYTYGWSENMGDGPGGRRLEYVRGKVIEAGPRRVVLISENLGGCYRVTKVATTRAGTRFWIIATRVTNACDKKIRFDLFSGDDPWIGTYRSSDGDVGWLPGELVRRERALSAGRFTAGGLYDLGNRALGQEEGSFSGMANFIALDPATPLPSMAAFANRFAHTRDEVDPGKALSNDSLTALNLAWTGLTLEPGQGFTFAMALGLAETGAAGSIPRLPVVSEADWSVWRAHLKEGNPDTHGAGLQFAAERVELVLSPGQLTVAGTYHLRNRGSGSGSATISFPIITAADRPAPATVTVQGQALAVKPVREGLAEVRFPVAFGPRGLTRFTVSYTQRHAGRRAAYMVTSARRWPTPIDRAVFVVRHPAVMGEVTLSFEPDLSEYEGDQVEHTIVRHGFWPARELELTW